MKSKLDSSPGVSSYRLRGSFEGIRKRHEDRPQRHVPPGWTAGRARFSGERYRRRSRRRRVGSRREYVIFASLITKPWPSVAFLVGAFKRVTVNCTACFRSSNRLRKCRSCRSKLLMRRVVCRGCRTFDGHKRTSSRFRSLAVVSIICKHNRFVS